MIDLLLTHGADKYMVAKLSMGSLAHVGKRAQLMLRKWYAMNSKSTTETTAVDQDSTSASDHCGHHRLHELRPLSPIMASLCMDDVDVFARLYKHHHVLFNYFKPDEDYELIYYAIRFQAKRCLVYLLTSTNSNETAAAALVNNGQQQNKQTMASSVSLPLDLNECGDSNSKGMKRDAETLVEFNKQLPSQLSLNKNVDTMFYILENTRSSRIVKVLLDCGFDLSRRDQRTGNTALHCLFNSSSLSTSVSTGDENGNESNKSGGKRPVCVLGEYHSPRSLSKILFVMLKKGGLKAHVNTLNGGRQLSMQALFEWDELVEKVFFVDDHCHRQHTNSGSSNGISGENSTATRQEWQHEFEMCVHLLLKSGADLLLTSTVDHDDYHITHNCLSTLFASFLKHSVTAANIASTSHLSTGIRRHQSSGSTNIGGNLNSSAVGSGSAVGAGENNRSVSPQLVSNSQILSSNSNSHQLNESLGVNISVHNNQNYHHHPHHRNHHNHTGNDANKSNKRKRKFSEAQLKQKVYDLVQQIYSIFDLSIRLIDFFEKIFFKSIFLHKISLKLL
jgi:hypothetical protein